MKKIIIMALVLVAGASFNTLLAKDKKDKKKKNVKTEVPAQIALQSSEDTLSYAAGKALTEGLETFLERQYGISDVQKADFVRGLCDAFKQRNDSVFQAYSTGIMIAEQLNKSMLPGLQQELGITNEELVFAGFKDGVMSNDTLVSTADAKKRFADARQAAKEKQEKAKKLEGEANKKAGEEFLAQNKNKDGIITTASGLQYKILKKGNGALPKASDKVEVIYEGKTLDGKVFDATAKHGTNSDTFNVGGLIKGWTEALQLMPVGSKWELYIPQELAYGERGAGSDIPPYSTLIFTLELLGIK